MEELIIAKFKISYQTELKTKKVVKMYFNYRGSCKYNFLNT